MTKRILSLALCALLLVSLASAALAAPQYTGASGTITAVNDAQIEVKKDDGETLVFNLDGNTVFLDRTNGVARRLSDLKPGMAFYAWHSPALTKSIPAQSYLHTMIVTTDAASANGFFFSAASAELTNDGVTLLNEKGDLFLTIPANVTVQAFAASGLQSVRPASIGKGAQLMAWYDAVASSYPGQATASKVLVFNAGTPAASPAPSAPPVSGVPQTGDTAAALASLLIAGAALALLLRKRAR